MNLETVLLVENISTQSSEFLFSEKVKASGYHYQDGIHSFAYNLINFTGTVKLQGTLELYPAENNWVDITDTEIQLSNLSNIINGNFSGNFIWVRAGYRIDQGLIESIRFNF